jgi:hypothetical protein
MLRYIEHITPMARGESGRIVIEVEPEVKRRLYSALALSGSTLKDWFIKAAADFCTDTVQPSLFSKAVPESDEGSSVHTNSPAAGRQKK